MIKLQFVKVIYGESIVLRPDGRRVSDSVIRSKPYAPWGGVVSDFSVLFGGFLARLPVNSLLVCAEGFQSSAWMAETSPLSAYEDSLHDTFNMYLFPENGSLKHIQSALRDDWNDVYGIPPVSSWAELEATLSATGTPRTRGASSREEMFRKTVEERALFRFANVDGSCWLFGSRESALVKDMEDFLVSAPFDFASYVSLLDDLRC